MVLGGTGMNGLKIIVGQAGLERKDLYSLGLWISDF